MTAGTPLNELDEGSLGRPDGGLGARHGILEVPALRLAVVAHGGRDVRVSQLALHVDEGTSGPEPRRGRGVAQVVESQRGPKPGRAQRRRVPAVGDVRPVEVTAPPAGKAIGSASSRCSAQRARWSARIPAIRGPISTRRARSAFVDPTRPPSFNARRTMIAPCSRATSLHWRARASPIRRPLASSSPARPPAVAAAGFEGMRPSSTACASMRRRGTTALLIVFEASEFESARSATSLRR
jgi:hypothetical protein